MRIASYCLALFLTLSIGLIVTGVLVQANNHEKDGFTYIVDDGEAIITDYCADGSKEVNIPKTLDGYDVKGIGPGAFGDKDLTSVTIPNSVIYIDEDAFRENALIEVDIPDSVISIGDFAFFRNDLTEVDIDGDSLTSIGNSAFRANQLASLDIPESVISIGEWTFSGNKIEAVDIPDSVTSIGNGAFAHNQLTSVDIPDSITIINTWAFQDNALTEVVIPESVTRISILAFAHNDLTEVDIPDSVNFINWSAFEGNKLESVVIPESVILIGIRAFADNDLTEVDIPDSVTSIDREAFRDNNLSKVVIYGINVNLGNDIFIDNKAGLELHGHTGSTVESYANANDHKFIALPSADLSSLTFSEGHLTPDFDPGTTDYDLDVNHNISSVDVTFTLDDENATSTIDGEEATCGEAVTIDLGDPGTETEIEIEVTTEDENIKRDYTVTVNRAEVPIHSITLSASPEKGGSVSGGGTFKEGEEVTVKAVAYPGYKFENWTEGVDKVSDSKEYTFTVTENRELVANFKRKYTRLAGEDRYQTTIEVSQAGWDSADTVVIARCDEYPDSLAGVSLAYLLDAPILLTQTEKLNEETGKEIERLNAKRAIVLGGTAAVAKEVEDELEKIVDTVDRIGGKNRYETAQLIAKIFTEKAGEVEEAFIAYGNNFPDALTAATYAAIRGTPILLTATETIHDSTKQAIEDLEIESTVVVGGEAVIGESLLKKLPNSTRIAGADRWETSLELAGNYLSEDTKHIYLATGRNFPDALAGAVLAAKEDSGILLVPGEKPELPCDIGQFISDWGITSTTILGGTAAMSEAMESDIKNLLDNINQ